MQLLHGDNPGKSNLNRPSHRPSHRPVTAHLSFYCPSASTTSRWQRITKLGSLLCCLIASSPSYRISAVSHPRWTHGCTSPRKWSRSWTWLVSCAFIRDSFGRPWNTAFWPWMGASKSSLKQLDSVQHRALRLIGPGVALPHLSHRHMVGPLCYMYKLHWIPPSHPVASLLPGPAVAGPNPRTRRSSITRHLHRIQHDHHARTASWNLRRFPNATSKAWNVLPPSLLQYRPELKRMQAFKNKINRHRLHSNSLAATDSLWLFPCCYLLTALLHFALYFPHSYSLIPLVFISFGQFSYDYSLIILTCFSCTYLACRQSSCQIVRLTASRIFYLSLPDASWLLGSRDPLVGRASGPRHHAHL